MKPSDALNILPSGLRDPLLEEYQGIVSNYSEHRWSPSELSGGRFCEVVYTILDGYASCTYETIPTKPSDFVSACRRLEQQTHVPRSFRILIPRLLPALYEVRNNRGVGHVGGEVDPNHMDATFVLGNANWIMGELVRVFHTLPITVAQELVDKIVEIRIPMIWEKNEIRRVLDFSLKQPPQILLLLASVGTVSISDLSNWIEVKNRSHFLKTLRKMHKERLLEFDEANGLIELLPPGSKKASVIFNKAIKT